ncbi:17-beta-hydroxysteroid dehydrogenase 14 [Varanus komodoensis]|nr:17-beta-hydroxysteroid dehydrogenase 14 [Varanus komodoensis]
MATGLRYADKVVIVTGGTRGIGEGIVREFGERGKALQQELEDCRGPGEARFVVCDVCSETDIKTLVSVTMELYGRLDCLVNNAGGPDPPEQRIDDVTAKEFRSLLDLNLVSCFLTSKFALTHLRKTKGNIINISSLVGITGQKYAVTYVATKLLGRMGTPAECAAAALYLAGDATFCTGTDLVLSAGAELGYAQKSRQGPSSGPED